MLSATVISSGVLLSDFCFAFIGIIIFVGFVLFARATVAAAKKGFKRSNREEYDLTEHNFPFGDR